MAGMSEHDEQVAVIRYCDEANIPIFAIPNGGRRDKRTAAHLKSEGVRAGVPDLCIPVPSGPYHGMFLELKDVDGRKPRESQMEWLDMLGRLGYRAVWARGAAAAVALIEEYMSL